MIEKEVERHPTQANRGKYHNLRRANDEATKRN